MKRRDIAILLGLASSFIVSLTYLIRPADPDQSAGGNFAWNIMFYFPAIAIESALAIVSLIYFVSYVRQPISKARWSIVIPPILILPCAHEVWCVITAMVAISRMTHGFAGP